MQAVPDPTLDRIHGALAGVAIGDALGATVEFATRAQARRAVKEEVGGWPYRLTGGGPFGWRPGEPTDDTDLTLVVAGALRKVGAAPTDRDKRLRYVARINRQVASGIGQWYETGPRDVGNTTARAARRILDGESPTGGREVYEQSNGSLMRTIAVGVAFPGDWRMVDTVARQVSAVTHAHPACLDACAAYSRAVWWLVRGDLKHGIRVLLDCPGRKPINIPTPSTASWYKGGGLVWDSYTLAAQALLRSLDVGPVDALIELAGLGGDADTNCAIAGGLLGAWWGHGRWLPEWRSGIETAKPMADLARYFARRWV